MTGWDQFSPLSTPQAATCQRTVSQAVRQIDAFLQKTSFTPAEMGTALRWVTSFPDAGPPLTTLSKHIAQLGDEPVHLAFQADHIRRTQQQPEEALALIADARADDPLTQLFLRTIAVDVLHALVKPKLAGLHLDMIIPEVSRLGLPWEPWALRKATNFALQGDWVGERSILGQIDQRTEAHFARRAVVARAVRSAIKRARRREAWNNIMAFDQTPPASQAWLDYDATVKMPAMKAMLEFTLNQNLTAALNFADEACTMQNEYQWPNAGEEAHVLQILLRMIHLRRLPAFLGCAHDADEISEQYQELNEDIDKLLQRPDLAAPFNHLLPVVKALAVSNPTWRQLKPAYLNTEGDPLARRCILVLYAELAKLTGEWETANHAEHLLLTQMNHVEVDIATDPILWKHLLKG